MADPLSITASLLAVTTAALQSTKSLYETIKRFKDRDKRLRRLQDELGDLSNILDSLTQVINTEQSVLRLLQGPVERCSQVCGDFEKSMKAFGGKSKTGFRDWTKMEFMRGDINEFIDIITGYKSTISIGLGTINLHTAKVSHQALQDYNEMIQDTSYNLELRLRQIDKRMTQLNTADTHAPNVTTDLTDEREVTKQCLRICEDARSYIESLSGRESSLFEEVPLDAAEETSFEAQLRTRQVLNESRDGLTKAMGHLRQRLEFLVQDDGSEKKNERLRLQEDISISKQCLDVCKAASEISRQTVYRIGEVIAEGDSDQVVVTTLADLFDVKKALSRDHSAQLVGSMTAENLRDLTEKRYSSRFGVATSNNNNPTASGTSSLPAVSEVQNNGPAVAPEPGHHEQISGLRTRQNRPAANEMRKRQVDDVVDEENSKTTGG